MIRLYLDEDTMRRSLVVALRSAGLDVLTTGEAGRRRESDDSQLAFTTSLGRVCYTANGGDFSQLHARYAAQGRSHSGIIILGEQRLGVGEQVRRILRLAAELTENDMKNRLEWLNRWVGRE